MKALAAKIKWWEGWGNDPVLELLIDCFPLFAPFRFEKRGPIYYAELDSYVRYYAYRKPDRGFGGRHFPITMKDGTEIILKGPWSSRPGAVHARGFGPCVSVSIVDDSDAFERGYTFIAGDVTLAFAQEAITKYLPSIELARVDAWSRDEHFWVPKRKGLPLKNTVGVKAMKRGE